jgi:uncharacterized coiled-coil DUF342 family protein
MDKKEEYIQKLDAQLREWSVKIDELKAKADKAKGDIKIEYARQTEALDAKREAARKNLRELREAGGQAWEELKAGAEKAWHELKTSLDNVVDKFKHH